MTSFEETMTPASSRITPVTHTLLHRFVAVFGGMVALVHAMPSPAGTVIFDVIGETDDLPATRLHLVSGAFESVRAEALLELDDFPLGGGALVNLEVTQFQVTAPGAHLVIGTTEGDVPVPYPEVALFRGHAPQWPDSWVFLGITPDRVNGIIHLSDDTEYIIAPVPERLASGEPDDHVIYDRFLLGDDLPFPPLECRPVERPDRPGARQSGRRGSPSSAYERRVGWIGVDCDWEFRILFLTHGDAMAYAVEVLAVTHMIYERDVDVRMYVNYLRVWDVPNDPYVATDLEDALEEFEDVWNEQLGHVSKDVAHLLSGRRLGGGIAYLDVLCDGFGVSGNFRGTFPRPPRDRQPGNWDIKVVQHEIGHNFGSPHTHCYDPPIDTCAGEGWDCPHPQVCQVGTLMSYCNLCPGDTRNVDLKFHPRVISEELREDVDCMRLVMNDVFVDYRNTEYEDGQRESPYNRVFKGVFGCLPSGTISVAPGNYPETMSITQPMKIQRWGDTGVVTIGR
ncbi:MAG: hypothetical protein C4547_02895 [Phycisphaerales bacterium]|nr:MAG: hypothetical protein C4547_02895 [Phycisphaerales bacterium]